MNFPSNIFMLGHEGEPHWVESSHWAKSNHTSEIGHHIFTQNLKALSLWVLSLVCCSTSTLPSNVGL